MPGHIRIHFKWILYAEFGKKLAERFRRFEHTEVRCLSHKAFHCTKVNIHNSHSIFGREFLLVKCELIASRFVITGVGDWLRRDLLCFCEDLFKPLSFTILCSVIEGVVALSRGSEKTEEELEIAVSCDLASSSVDLKSLIYNSIS